MKNRNRQRNAEADRTSPFTTTLPGGMLDVAIVGGGCAGLYSAWRLFTQEKKRKKKPLIRVFEASNRIGGRLLSVRLLRRCKQMAELGGMRFTEGQVIVSRLTRELKQRLAKDLRHYRKGKHRKNNPLRRKKFNFKTELMFLRGESITEQNFNLKRPYDLRKLKLSKKTTLSDAPVRAAKKVFEMAAKKMLTNDETLNTALKRLIKRLSGDKKMSVGDWNVIQQAAKIDKHPLSDIGLWNLIQHFVREAPDTFLFLHDALGYESLLANSNAAQAIPWFLKDFESQNYFSLSGGMESIPKMLAYELLKINQGSCIALEHSVTEIRLVRGKGGRTHFELRMTHSPGTPEESIGFGRCKAKKVILALPKKALKQINFVNFPATETRRLSKLLDEVTAHPAFKLFLGYDKAWWAEKGDLSIKARAVTDLPIRQVYYMGSKKGPSMVMASYSDEHYVDFWDPLVRDPDHEGEKLTLDLLGKTSEISTYAASDRIVKKATDQLRIMHKMKIPREKFGVLKEWEEAWHFWNVYSKPWKAAKRMVRPFNNLDLFTCGEAYSLEQGWVEGALKSAERVLAKFKDVHEPRWIRKKHWHERGYQNFKEYIEH